jgi:hypothetical protein
VNRLSGTDGISRLSTAAASNPFLYRTPLGPMVTSDRVSGKHARTEAPEAVQATKSAN